MKKITNNKQPIALIYCRVSSERQMKEGNGLDSQEHRCKEYAKIKGYEVEKSFKESFSGGGDYRQRPGLSLLLQHLEKNVHKNYVVLIDDLSRFARDVQAHFQLKTLLKSKDVSLECSNFNFDDTPEGELIETMMAAQHQYHRKNNRRQVIQKMKARLESGFWPFNSTDIPGYCRTNPERDWVLVRKEPEASIIKEALEGFASGRFQQQIDVAHFLKRKKFFGKKKRKEVYLSQVNRMLTRVEYAGYIEFIPWEVDMRKGRHEGIITLKTFEKIQERLRVKKRVRIRDDYSSDFPLRPYVRCWHCTKPLTASWSKGRRNHYAYYRCSNNQCPVGNKSVSKDKIESDFEDLLGDIAPKEKLLKLTEAVLNDLYEKKHSEFKKGNQQNESRIVAIKGEIDQIMKNILRTKNELMIGRYEEKVSELSQELQQLEESTVTNEDFDVSFGTAVNEVLEIIRL